MGRMFLGLLLTRTAPARPSRNARLEPEAGRVGGVVPDEDLVPGVVRGPALVARAEAVLREQRVDVVRCAARAREVLGRDLDYERGLLEKWHHAREAAEDRALVAFDVDLDAPNASQRLGGQQGVDGRE